MSQTIVRNNATIAHGTTFTDVNHGLSAPPNVYDITLQPEDDLGGRTCWVSDITGTTFRINISFVDPEVDHVIGYTIITTVSGPTPPTQPPAGPGMYVSAEDVQAHLNASYDAISLTYTIFGLPVSQASFQAHVYIANLYVNSIVGSDLQASDPRYNWAKMAAVQLACLRILVAASGGMLQGAFDYRLGDLYITKASIGKLAFESAAQGFRNDLIRTLTNFARPVVAAEASAKDDVPTYQGGLINP